MHDTFAVHEADCRHQLLHDDARLDLREAVALANAPQQLATAEQLQHDVRVHLRENPVNPRIVTRDWSSHNSRTAKAYLVVVDFVHLNDVWMTLTQPQELDFTIGVRSPTHDLDCVLHLGLFMTTLPVALKHKHALGQLLKAKPSIVAYFTDRQMENVPSPRRSSVRFSS